MDGLPTVGSREAADVLRRATEGPLGVNAEMVAAGYLNGF